MVILLFQYNRIIDRPKLERENDIFLMDTVCARSKEELSDAKVRTINYCRNYLEVKRLSDICTADGQFILPSVWDEPDPFSKANLD